jgi:hypothetical protein
MGVDRGFAQNFLFLTCLLEVMSNVHRRLKTLDLEAFMRPSPNLSRMSRYQMRSYGVAKFAVTA